MIVPPQETVVDAKPRRRLWAALLALLCPGLGQLYVVRARRGLIIAAVAMLLQTAAMAAAGLAAPTPTSFALTIAAAFSYFGLYLFALVDAIRCATPRTAPRLGRWNRKWVYVAAIVGWTVFTQGVALIMEENKQVNTYTIPANSMAPGLVPGDYVVASRNTFANREPQYGDIAVFAKPGPEAIPYVKRVVGLPGDRVQLRDGQLWLNGTAMPQAAVADQAGVFAESLPNGRTYRVHIDNRRHFLENTPVYEVPGGHYFLLGDNRENSADSRFTDEVGFVPRAALHDRVLFLFWARELERIGQSVE